MSQAKPVSQKKAVFVVGLMFAMFVVPYTYILYIYETGQMPTFETTEKGVFFEEFIDLNSYSFNNPLNKEQTDWSIDTFKGQWVVANFVTGDCDKPCLDRFFNTQQALKTLTRFKGRTDQVAVVNGDTISEDLKTVITLRPRLQTAFNAKQLEQSMKEALLKDNLQPNSLKNYIGIISPDGHLLMYYSPDKEVKKVLRDIKRLLKVSVSGYRADDSGDILRKEINKPEMESAH